jgi:hypothetical protein
MPYYCGGHLLNAAMGASKSRVLGTLDCFFAVVSVVGIS